MVGVRATREGILVLHHASTLGRRRLSKLTHEQASERARDRGLELATLAEAVDAADPVPVNAELATADHAAPVVDELRRHEHPDRSLATAFRPDPLERVHDRVPRIDTGLLLSPARALRLLYRRKRAEILQRRVEALPVDALIPGAS
jgi:glycerophosphoryl diester phosphodiesterase